MDQDLNVKTITEDDLTPTEGDLSQRTEYDQQPLKLDGQEVKSQKDIDLAFIKQKKEAEAREAELKKQLDEVQKKVQEYQPVEQIASVPILPDRFDTDDLEFERAVSERDAIIKKNHEIAIRNQIKDEADKKAQQKIAALETEKLQNRVNDYVKRVKDYKIPEQEAITYENTIINSGASQILKDAILDDAQGPMIAKYLHENQIELYQIGSLSPIQLGEYISTNIKPKIAPKPPKNINTPPPLDNPSVSDGANAGEQIDPLLAGAHFKTYRKGR